jgi:hypothetical protein
MRWVCIVKTRKNINYYYEYDYLLIVALTTMCNENASMTKQWAPLGLPDAFDFAGPTFPVSLLVATRGAMGGVSGG